MTSMILNCGETMTAERHEVTPSNVYQLIYLLISILISNSPCKENSATLWMWDYKFPFIISFIYLFIYWHY